MRKADVDSPTAHLRGLVAALLLLAACGDDAGGAFTAPPPPPPDAAADPCHGVATSGQCSDNDVELCVVGTGSAQPFVTTLRCGDARACVETAAGATCELVAECDVGASECQADDLLAECDHGFWRLTRCARGCASNALEASCRPEVPTFRYQGTLSYEARYPNEDFSDWATDWAVLPAQGFLIVSIADNLVLDVATTALDDVASFSIDAVRPEAVDGDDFLVALPLRLRDDGALAYGVWDPQLPSGENSVDLELGGKFWAWSWTVDDIASGDGVHLPLASGSSSAFVYDYLRRVYDFAERFFGVRADSSLVVWHGLDVDWSCGACFVNAAWQGDFVAASQMFIPGGPDEGHWSGAVLAHELGHWLMSTYGSSPGEGGTHILGVPSHPGLAWSEGFATWFSELARGETFYYDKQDGLFIWVDHLARAFHDERSWFRPLADFGLEQLISEDEVVAMLTRVTTPDNEAAMLAAIASPRMTQAPFLRGYLRRTWDGLSGEGLPIPYEVTDVSAPHLADFLDALVCDGVVAPSEVDAATEPLEHYPFPSRDPLCRSGRLPLSLRWSADDDPTVEVRWAAPLPGALRLRWSGSKAWQELATAATSGARKLRLARRSDAPGVAREADVVEVAVDGPDWHVRGSVSRRPAPSLRVQRDGPVMSLRGISIPTIRVHARSGSTTKGGG